MSTRRRSIPTLIICAFLAACSTDDNIAGKPAGSETSDEVAARVLDTSGAPLADAQVKVRPFWYVLDSTGRPNHYDAAQVVDLRTDSAGRMTVKLPRGTYRIEVVGPRQGIVIPLELGKIGANLPDQRARPLGSMAGHVSLPQGARGAWIRVFGQDRLVHTDDAGNFFLSDVVYGDSAMLLSATANGISSELGQAAIHVVPHTVVFGALQPPGADQETYSTWRTSVLRTGLLSGVAKASTTALGPVTALVRLDTSNFDFRSAAGDGRDLRFALPDGRHLAWFPRFYDSAAGLAQIDVRLPGMRPGDTVPVIQILSGRDHVPSRADSSTVWSGIVDSLVAAATSFVVDDFDPVSNRAALPPDIPIGTWYMGLVGKDTLIQPAGGSGHGATAIEPADSGRSGNAFHLKFAVGDTTGSSYVVLGTNIAARSRTFRALDSLVFWVRGTGRFSFAMEDSIPVSRKATVDFATTPSWKRYRVRPADFLPAGGNGNTGWIGTRDSIRRISFIVMSGGDFWVADIRVYGLGVDEMR